MSNGSCKGVPDVQCAVSGILDRIEPIRFEDGVLMVDGSFASSGTTLLINDEAMTAENGVLNLPPDSTIDHQPLQGLPFTGDTLELPQHTTINGFQLFTTNYFYLMNNGNKNSGNYIVNSSFPLNPTYNFNGINFPLIVPRDCVLTSFIFSFVGNKGGGTDITNINAYIDIIDQAGAITYTGISVNIPTCPPNTKPFADKTLNYPLIKGYAVGVRFTYNGTVTTTHGGYQFSTIGYKFLV